MPDERFCVLGLGSSSSQGALADSTTSWRRTLSLGLIAGSLAISSVALASAPASADEGATESVISNERLPRVSGPVEVPFGDGLLPWTTVAANDMRGYRASTYTGKYYDKRFEQYRLCVVQREGGGSYSTVYRGFYGAYQFGTVWNTPSKVSSRLRAEFGDVFGAVALREIDKLASRPISTWNRFWQDAAFWTTFNRGAGWRQWWVGWDANWACDHRPNAESGWPSSSHYNYSPIERGGLNKVAKEYRNVGQPGTRSSDTSATSTRSKTAQQIREKYGRAPAAVGTPRYSKWLARKVIRAEYDWGRGQFRALAQMWFKESNWRYEVVNWQGPWYGLGQVNGPYINSRGYSIEEYRNSPYIQIRVGADYIKGRYGTPRAAWKEWQIKGWY